MSISFDKFVEWAENRFNGDIVVKGKEVRINSIFTEDYKHKMWCNPHGGKKERPNGVFHCWKTDRKGSLITLVMMVDGCTYEEALETLEGQDISFAALEKAIDELYDKPKAAAIQAETKMQFPPGTFLINNLPTNNYFRLTAEAYLKGRMIPTEGLMVCTGEEPWLDELHYNNRLIIPYYDRNGQLIYFNGRYLGARKEVIDKMKYLGPPKSIGVGKEDVLFMTQWPSEGKVYFCEGELDAKSIHIAGLPSGAWGGKNVSDTQAKLMRPYIPVICLDNDKAGREALPKIAAFLRERGFKEIWYVKPCGLETGKKVDWNDMLVKFGPKLLKAYILRYEKRWDELDELKALG